ncbi:MAG: hypothetical protein LPK03_12400 [Pontibacter sp.]|nr:hypothetical protein [Pontibacter sp.]
MMKKTGLLAGFSLLFALNTQTWAQEHHAGHKDMSNHSLKHQGQQDTTTTTTDGPPMSHAFSLSLPMARNGSGTGTLPDASPMYGYMFHSKRWMYMAHGNVFLRYNKQDVGEEGSRGGSKVDAPNWFMGMGQTRVGTNGLFRFSTMISLDPLTVGGEGYPLLFQSGETWKGQPLVDRQHPHDLFSELSVAYAHRLSEDADAFAYSGLPGEPAFGPVAFMHRVSSMANPDAPIGHHWQDATHITFGVGTLGFRYRTLKLEGSVFTGREPNEKRYGFDRPRFDSWSTRLSYHPSPAWALQVSKAWVEDMHEIGPREDVDKTSASVINAWKLSTKSSLHSTAVWGQNKTAHHGSQYAFLLESALQLHNTALYGKYEWVEKSTEDLLLNEDHYGHGKLYPVHAFTLGLNQLLAQLAQTNLSIGAQASLYNTPTGLTELYGKNPVSLQAYLRISPSQMRTSKTH